VNRTSYDAPRYRISFVSLLIFVAPLHLYLKHNRFWVHVCKYEKQITLQALVEAV